MTYRQFMGLDEESQQAIFIQQGVVVAERTEALYYYQLYQIDGFYIEIQFNRNFDKVLSSMAFQSLHKLDPYLQLISIPWKSRKREL